MARGFVSLIGIVCALVSVEVYAAILPAIDAFPNSGNYTVTGFYSSTSTSAPNYTSRLNFNNEIDRRSFFVFDLSNVVVPTNEIITAAEIRLDTEASPTAASTFTLFDYPDPSPGGLTIDALLMTHDNVNAAEGQQIYNALGSGTDYGFLTFASDISSATTLSFDLNADAVNDINAALGGRFAVGGAFTSVGPTGAELFRTGGNSTATRQLILTTTAVPEPSSLAVLAICGAGVATRSLRRRRKKRRHTESPST